MQRELDQFEQMQDNCIWHYTDWDTCTKIMDTARGVAANVLRASDLSYMNDESELRYAISLLLSTCPPADRQILEREIHGSMQLAHVYAACFSEESDSLSQWRAYGGSGVQVAIGFDAQKIEAIAAKQYFRKLKCEYDLAKQVDILSTLVAELQPHKTIIETAKKWADQAKREGRIPESTSPDVFISPPQWRGMRGSMAGICGRYLPRVKHDRFADEKEVRLVSPPTLEHLPTSPQLLAVNHFVRHRMVVPYVELNIADDSGAVPIRGIRVGPGPHAESNVRALRAWLNALDRHRYAGIPVLQSRAPFRNW